MKSEIKTKHLLAALLLGLAAPVAGQSAIGRLYTDMPEAVDPVMPRKQRAELLEYVKAGMGDSIANRFGRQAHMTVLDTLHQRLVVRNTATSTLELKLLVHGGDSTVALIRTVCTPLCHSVLRLYDTRWHALPAAPVALPRSADWLDGERAARHGADTANLRRMLAADFVSLTFADTGDTLVARNHILDYLSEDDRERVRPYLKEEAIALPASTLLPAPTSPADGR